jgi:hypothetical protein
MRQWIFPKSNGLLVEAAFGGNPFWKMTPHKNNSGKLVTPSLFVNMATCFMPLL